MLRWARLVVRALRVLVACLALAVVFAPAAAAAMPYRDAIVQVAPSRQAAEPQEARREAVRRPDREPPRPPRPRRVRAPAGARAVVPRPRLWLRNATLLR